LKPDANLIPTPSQTVGPFFQIELTTAEHRVSCVAGPQARGERVWITFRVLDGDGAPVDDAMLEVWQADSNGKYNHPDDSQPKQLDEIHESIFREVYVAVAGPLQRGFHRRGDRVDDAGAPVSLIADRALIGRQIDEGGKPRSAGRRRSRADRQARPARCRCRPRHSLARR